MTPCPQCYIAPDETCSICGAKALVAKAEPDLLPGLERALELIGGWSADKVRAEIARIKEKRK